MKITFPQIGYFRACRLAEEWCKENGISVGPMQRGDPRGLMRGDISIAKWRNLNDQDRAELHGQMTGNMREGPVVITLIESAAARVKTDVPTPSISESLNAAPAADHPLPEYWDTP